MGFLLFALLAQVSALQLQRQVETPIAAAAPAEAPAKETTEAAAQSTNKTEVHVLVNMTRTEKLAKLASMKEEVAQDEAKESELKKELVVKLKNKVLDKEAELAALKKKEEEDKEENEEAGVEPPVVNMKEEVSAQTGQLEKLKEKENLVSHEAIAQEAKANLTVVIAEQAKAKAEESATVVSLF